jgi:hypothetical protein
MTTKIGLQDKSVTQIQISGAIKFTKKVFLLTGINFALDGRRCMVKITHF